MNLTISRCGSRGGRGSTLALHGLHDGAPPGSTAWSVEEGGYKGGSLHAPRSTAAAQPSPLSRPESARQVATVSDDAPPPPAWCLACNKSASWSCVRWGHRLHAVPRSVRWATHEMVSSVRGNGSRAPEADGWVTRHRSTLLAGPFASMAFTWTRLSDEAHARATTDRALTPLGLHRGSASQSPMSGPIGAVLPIVDARTAAHARRAMQARCGPSHARARLDAWEGRAASRDASTPPPRGSKRGRHE